MKRYGLMVFVVLLAIVAVSDAHAQVFGKGSSVIVSRPDPEGVPTDVRIGCYVVDLVAINDVKQSFTADVFFKMQWKDKRLAPAGADSIRRIPINEVWYPNFTLMNRRDMTAIFAQEVEVDAAGTVTYRQRVFGNFSLPLNLREFPFDSHEIPIRLSLMSFDRDAVHVALDEDVMGRSDTFSVADWTIGELVFKKSAFTVASMGKSLPLYVFSMKGKRKVDFYVWRIILPLMIIMLMSWVVFWMDPVNLAPQIGVAATSILTLIAFQFTVGFLLPRISYLTRMDLLILVVSVLVFLALIEAVVAGALAARGRGALATRLDRWSRILFPLTFIVCIILDFVL